MPELTPSGEIRARLHALRLFVIGLSDDRLRDLDTLLSVAEAEAERYQKDIGGGTARHRNADR